MSGVSVAASSVMIGNLIYLVGAVALMIVITLIIVLSQRKPKSVEAHMESFNRGLQALAPTPTSQRRAEHTPESPRVEARLRVTPKAAESDRTPASEA